MKKNKVLSLFLALTMVVICAFSGVCEAVAVQGGSNIAQNQGASSVKLSNGKVLSKVKGIAKKAVHTSQVVSSLAITCIILLKIRYIR